MSVTDEKYIESQLKGRTLHVYWHLLRHGSKPIGVRELQRVLHLSSPSVAFHHLEKLHRLGLLKKRITGDYVLVQRIKVGVLKQFIGFGRVMLPRYLFYAVLFTTMFVAYLGMYPQTFNPNTVIVWIFGLLSCLVFWYETVRVFRQAPS